MFDIPMKLISKVRCRESFQLSRLLYYLIQFKLCSQEAMLTGIHYKSKVLGKFCPNYFHNF